MYWYDSVILHTSSLVSIQMHATQALALRKRKPQAKQALALATMIGCFDRVFLLAGACVRCVKNRIGSVVAISYAMTACVSCVRDFRLHIFVFCLHNFLAFLAYFILLAYFFLCKTFHALRAFEWKPCFRNIKIEWWKQLYHNNTLPLFSSLPKLGQWMWRQLTERMHDEANYFEQLIPNSRPRDWERPVALPVTVW